MSGELIIGVLGGMGPEATIDFQRRVLALTPASDDADHLRMLIDNNPKVPSRLAAIVEGTGEDPTPALIAMAQGLERQGADFLVMPCNTAHHYHSAVAEAVSIPFLHMPALAAKSLASEDDGSTRVGLLASSALSRIQLYEPHFEEHLLELLYPTVEVQSDLMALIQAVKAGDPSVEKVAAFDAAARDLEERGAQQLLIACTELSALADSLCSGLSVTDASQVLAEVTVAIARGQRSLG
ncbi:MAG: amino acid racemase [Pseudomonadota bacterium]